MNKKHIYGLHHYSSLPQFTHEYNVSKVEKNVVVVICKDEMRPVMMQGLQIYGVHKVNNHYHLSPSPTASF